MRGAAGETRLGRFRQSVRVAQRPELTEVDAGAGPSGMAWIPGGTFAMGSEDFYPEEQPVHRASVDGFWIDKHPVTAAEFRRFVRETGYTTLGTLEFLMDEKQNLYFMEMNTRVQVEHPVTELITGVDIVQEQIRVAAGMKLRYRQKDIVKKGHAIECRINAENPYSFVPSPGRITQYHVAGGPGIRYDSHVYANYYVPPHYDSLVGKLLAYGDTREQAIARMRVALSEMVIEGIQTNIPLHQELMNDAAFIRGGVNIHFLEEKMAALKSIQAES